MTNRFLGGFLLLAALLGPSAQPAVAAVLYGDAQAVEYRHAVARWYVPTAQDDRFVRYLLDVTVTVDPVLDRYEAHATFEKASCDRVSEDVIECSKARKRHSRSATLDITTDLSRAEVVVEFGGRTYEVTLDAAQRSSGAFERGHGCGGDGVAQVAGAFANMDSAHGSLPGHKFEGPFDHGLDHYWVERGFGIWC